MLGKTGPSGQTVVAALNSIYNLIRNLIMKAQGIRTAIRWVHIAGGLVIMCYIYSPFHEHVAFQWGVKAGVVPVLTFTGIWLWKFPQFNKMFGIRA